MRVIRVAKTRLGVAGELFAFLTANKRWWVLPMIFVTLLVGMLVLLAQSSGVASFIYTLF